MSHKHLCKGVIDYLDDIIIYLKARAEHMKLLDGVLRELKIGDSMNYPKKNEFAFHELVHLGCLVNGSNVKPIPKN